MGYEQPRISFLQGLSPRRCFPAGTCSRPCDSLTTRPKTPLGSTRVPLGWLSPLSNTRLR